MSIIQPTRRGLIGGMAALFAGPAIVRASSLMPVRSTPASIVIVSKSQLGFSTNFGDISDVARTVWSRETLKQFREDSIFFDGAQWEAT